MKIQCKKSSVNSALQNEVEEKYDTLCAGWWYEISDTQFEANAQS